MQSSCSKYDIQHSSKQNLDLSNINCESKQKGKNSCYESDEQHSGKQNRDLNSNIFEKELHKSIRKKRIQVLAMNLINSFLASQIEIIAKENYKERIINSCSESYEEH